MSAESKANYNQNNNSSFSPTINNSPNNNNSPNSNETSTILATSFANLKEANSLHNNTNKPYESYSNYKKENMINENHANFIKPISLENPNKSN